MRVRAVLIATLFTLIATFSFAQTSWFKSQLGSGPYEYWNCGPAVASMAIDYSTLMDVPVEKVRKMIGLSRPNGDTSFEELERVMKKYDVNFQDEDWGEIHAVEIDPLLNMGYVVVVLVDLSGIPDRTNRGRGPQFGGHYLILSAVDGDNYIVQDPYNGPDIKFNRFSVTRAMTTTRMILISPFESLSTHIVQHPVSERNYQK